jgi:hypothetical protein
MPCFCPGQILIPKPVAFGINTPYVIGIHRKESTMMTKADRSAISRAVAKAIAYHDCGKPEKAAAWAAEVVRLLGAQGILAPDWQRRHPE